MKKYITLILNMTDLHLIFAAVSKLWETIGRVLSSVVGWIFLIFGMLFEFIAPEKNSFLFVTVAIILDAFFGILRSVKLKQYVLSKLARVTLFKVFAYGAALFVAFMIEKLVHEEGFFAIKLAAVVALACEFWSMSASILIIWPEAKFFKLMRIHLAGEIDRKLGDGAADVLKDEVTDLTK